MCVVHKCKKKEISLIFFKLKGIVHPVIKNIISPACLSKSEFSLEYTRRETEDTDCSESELKLAQLNKGALEYKLHESKANKFKVVLKHLKALLEKHYTNLNN